MAEVAIQNVGKAFGPVVALDDVSLDFPDGSFFTLLGPSGSGKTTLLRVIAGFEFIDQGSICICGQPVDQMPVEKRDIGMMFQNYALFPNMTVAENIGFGLRVRKTRKSEERRRIGEALELVQLEGYGERKPHELSGGQQQRVALARAIVTDPRVLLLDEPLSALDKSLRQDMQFELKRIQRETGITTILVTHDQEEALTLSDYIGVLRDGRLVQTGTPRQVYDQPVDMFTASFLGETNILDVQPKDGWLQCPDGSRIPLAEKSGEARVFAIRPENIVISATKPRHGTALPARLLEQVFFGAMTSFFVEAAGMRIKVTLRDRDVPRLEAKTDAWISWKPEDMLVIG